MKHIWHILGVCLILLCTGCAEAGIGQTDHLPDKPAETADTESEEDTGIPQLKIRAYVSDGKEEVLTELVQGEVYPIKVGGGEDCNIGLQFSCEGYVIGISAEEYLLEMSVGSKDHGPWDSGNTHEPRNAGFDQQITNEGFVSVLPIFAGHGCHVNFPAKSDVWGDYTSTELQKKMSFTGQEYPISVHVYTLNDPDSPILRARLMMIQQDDPWEVNDYTSGHFTISLVEYELSDKYKMMLE